MYFEMDSFVSMRLATSFTNMSFLKWKMGVAMRIPELIIKGLRTISACGVMVGLCAGIATNAIAADEPTKKEETAKKIEPITQSGSFLIKFKASTSDAKIQEVAEYYGANKVLSLSSTESTSRKDPDQWQKLKFDAVVDVKDIARRIIQDMRVDEVDEVVAQINK